MKLREIIKLLNAEETSYGYEQMLSQELKDILGDSNEEEKKLENNNEGC
jgi:hypothetical protein